VKSPPQPHDSLPTPQKLTLCGFAKTILHALGRPRRQIRRSVAVLEPFEKDPHVTTADIRREIRSAPTIRRTKQTHRFRNDCSRTSADRPEDLRTALSFCILCRPRSSRVSDVSLADPTPSRQSY
jgi:hypothetical protein